MVEAVLEPLEGAPAHIRRRWSDDFKFGVAAESLLPGARPSRIAQRIGVATTQIFQWRKQAIRKGWISLPSAIPEVARATSVSSDQAVIEIVVDGVIVRTHADNDQDHISRVIRAVRQA
jgi:transposase